MSEEMLFDVPRNKTRLELVKEQHTIHTHDFGRSEPGFPRWVAVLMNPVWKMGYGVKEGDDIGTCYSHVARLIDEGEYSGYGETEVDAVIAVCAQNKIEVVL